MNKILLVDDDIDFIEINKTILEANEFEVETAETEAEALKKLEEYQPNLIIMDLMMEHYDSGFTLAHKIKSHDESKHVPIIMVTGVATETGKRFSLNSKEEKEWIKVDAYLEKPISPDDLIGTINNLLKG